MVKIVSIESAESLIEVEAIRAIAIYLAKMSIGFIVIN